VLNDDNPSLAEPQNSCDPFRLFDFERSTSPYRWSASKKSIGHRYIVNQLALPIPSNLPRKSISFEFIRTHDRVAISIGDGLRLQ
jgi:hypothetical protein